MNSSRPRFFERWELLLCIVASGIAIWLHVEFLTHAGALWRDEVCAINTALMPTFAELWGFLTLDSAGLGSPFFLRGWSVLGLGGSDAGWRTYGFLIGLAVLGSLWLNARMLGRKLPLFSLGLLCTSVVLVRWGDSVRAYGLACAAMLLTLGLVWRLAQSPTAMRFALATVAAIISVNTIYGNAFLLLAAGLSASLVCWRRRQWKSVAMVLGSGLIAALSLIPYVPGIRASSSNWWIIQKTGFVPDWIWFNFSSATGSPYEWQTVVWLIIVPLAMMAGLVNGWRGASAEADLQLFAGATMLLATGFFMFFIWMSGLPTQVWYFLPLLVVLAACVNAALPDALEQIVSSRVKSAVTLTRWRQGTVACIGLIILVTCPKSAELTRPRQTNVDQIAAYLNTNAVAGDVIVIHPWYSGVTFQRYYRGQAKWFTTPPIPDHRVQRFDTLMEHMLGEDPMPPVVESCTEALTSGHRVWMIGWFQFTAARPPYLLKPPDGPQGWNEVPYEDAWAAQIPYLVVNHASELINVPDDPRLVFSPYEQLALNYARGWRTNAAPVNLQGSPKRDN